MSYWEITKSVTKQKGIAGQLSSSFVRARCTSLHSHMHVHTRMHTHARAHGCTHRALLRLFVGSGLLDGYFPWGAAQCFVKGASFGLGQR